MEFRTAATALAVTAGTVLATGGTVQAGEEATSRARPSTARLVGVVHIDPRDPRVAHLSIRYRCTGEGSLWVSVKQTADRDADPRLAAHGSSRVATAWSDSHRNRLTCDGERHTQRVTVDQEEPYFDAQGNPVAPKHTRYRPLEAGKAWFQLCLFDATTTQGPVSQMRFRTVLGPSRA